MTPQAIAAGKLARGRLKVIQSYLDDMQNPQFDARAQHRFAQEAEDAATWVLRDLVTLRVLLGQEAARHPGPGL